MDWKPGVAEDLGEYVYLLTDPRNGGRVFYVGKGSGSRCFSHVNEARCTEKDSKGDYEKLAVIREVEASGHEVGIEILRHGLTTDEAFIVEAAAMDLLGFSDLTNRVVGKGTRWRGRMSADDINAQYGATPLDFDPSHRVILIRIPRVFSKGMDADLLYEATRKWWKVGERRPKAEFAMAVHGGVVRAVYRIDRWVRPRADDIEVDPKREGRWAFEGHIDEAMESIYKFADVTQHLALGAQNPIRYVNC